MAGEYWFSGYKQFFKENRIMRVSLEISILLKSDVYPISIMAKATLSGSF